MVLKYSPDDDFRNSWKFKKGCTGEHKVAEWFKARNWYVIPSYDYSGEDGNKAPKLQGGAAQYVLPDLGVAKGGRTYWVEVKTKAEATYYRIKKRHEHGIPIRHYEDYQKIQEITGFAVFLCICEEGSGAMLIASLAELKKDERYWDGNAGNGYKKMVYFPRSIFKVLATIDWQ